MAHRSQYAALVAICVCSGAVVVWNTSREVAVLEGGHTGTVSAALFSRDGTMVATACADGIVQIWSSEGWDVKRRLATGSATTTSVRWSPASGSLLLVENESGIILWDWKSDELVLSLVGSSAHDAKFSPDGTLLAAVVQGGPVEVWSVSSVRKTAVLPSKGDVVIAGFSPNDATVVTMGVDPTAGVCMSLWEISSGRRLGEVPPRRDRVPLALWSTDGTKIATPTMLGPMEWWTGQQLTPTDSGNRRDLVVPYVGLKSPDASRRLVPDPIPFPTRVRVLGARMPRTLRQVLADPLALLCTVAVVAAVVSLLMDLRGRRQPLPKQDTPNDAGRRPKSAC